MARDVDDEDRDVPAATTYGQYVWDLRYVDAPVVAFQDRDLDGDLDESYAVVYYCTDANMNVTALVNASGGNVANRYVYDPYGAPRAFGWAIQGDDILQWVPIEMGQAVPNEVLYAGYRYDPETGLYHVRNRAYAPHLGRWLQRDPIGYFGRMSLYLYVDDTPLRYQDPMGLWKVNRNHKDRATATAEKGDTLKKLANKVHLEPQEVAYWARGEPRSTKGGIVSLLAASLGEEICPGEEVTIPNTFFLGVGEVRGFPSRMFIAWHARKLEAALERKGFKVLRVNGVDKDSKSVSSSINTDIWGYALFGHGREGDVTWTGSAIWGATDLMTPHVLKNSYKYGAGFIYSCHVEEEYDSWRQTVSEKGTFGIARSLFGYTDAISGPRAFNVKSWDDLVELMEWDVLDGAP